MPKKGRADVDPILIRFTPQQKKALEMISKKEYKTITLLVREAVDAMLKLKAEAGLQNKPKKKNA